MKKWNLPEGFRAFGFFFWIPTDSVCQNGIVRILIAEVLFMEGRRERSGALMLIAAALLTAILIICMLRPGADDPQRSGDAVLVHAPGEEKVYE